MKIKRSDHKRARIEMLPLIDVVFLLLVFFVYAMLSMVVHRGISVNLPRAKSALVDKKDYVSLTITDRGDIYVDDEKTSLNEMKVILFHLRKETPDLRVFISGDRNAFYERVVEVLDVVRETGLTRVSLETEFEEREPKSEISNR